MAENFSGGVRAADRTRAVSATPPRLENRTKAAANGVTRVYSTMCTRVLLLPMPMPNDSAKVGE
jgi:hypothetical protein